MSDRRLAILGLTAALAACHTKAPALTPSATPPSVARSATAARPLAPPPPPAPRPHSPSEDELFAAKSLEQLNSEHPLGDAYFDYNQSTLRDDAKDALQRDVQWLRRWSMTHITIQGQCDERGSAEYNLGLGDRRARAIRDYLEGLGVPESRMVIVSLGKESPVCLDDNEQCWSKNRRGHFVVTAK